MTGSEVFDVAIRIYQLMGWTFLKLTVVPSLFCLAAMTFFLRYVWPSYFVSKSPGSESAQMVEFLSTTALAFFVAIPLFLVGISYTSVVVTQLVSDYMLGNAPSGEAADAKGRQLLTKLFWLNARETALGSGGLFVSLALLALAAHIDNITGQGDATAALVLIIAWVGFFAGGIIFLVVVTRHALAPAILTLENTTISQACKRSASLLKTFGRHPSGSGNIWGLYGLLLLLWLLVGGGISMAFDMVGLEKAAGQWVSGIPFSPLIVEALALIPTFLVLWTLIPVWAASTTIVYYDRRIRLEGYDIEALSEDVWRSDRSRRFEL